MKLHFNNYITVKEKIVSKNDLVFHRGQYTIRYNDNKAWWEYHGNHGLIDSSEDVRKLLDKYGFSY